MTLRLRPIQKPVEILHDGELLLAEAGEPLAFSLIGSERLLLARSPKLHRPRGPYCLGAACDGCLVRVDGVPNVMACQHRVRGGETVETQNVVGSRKLDLLAASDFMFPHGIDHHRLFAGVRGVSEVVQRVARRIAGLGRLPDQAVDVEPAELREVDVLVVGGGQSGLTLAQTLGARALLVEASPEFGGALRLLDPARAENLVREAQRSHAELACETSAVAVFGARPFGVLLARERGVTWLRVQRLVLANGGHAALPDFASNDLPGIFSARAGLCLLRRGILPGKRVAVIGSGRFAERARFELGAHLVYSEANAHHVEAALGAQRVSRLRLASGETSPPIDAVLFDAPEAPAFELAVQAGARVRFEPALGYTLERDASGALAEALFAVGSVAALGDGASLAPHAAAARLLAQRSISEPNSASPPATNTTSNTPSNRK